MARNPGDKFGQYRLIKLLGRGGMGEVWRATDADPSYSGPDFALKILFDMNEEAGVSIRREIEASRRLDHESICRLLDFGSVQGTGFLAFELLDGRDLRILLREAPEGRLPVEIAVPILCDVLRGLAHAHARGVFHRDLKPENVRVLSNGRAKIMDFGIAKVRSVTRAVTIEIDNAPKRIGTPPYMAPEQWEGEGEEFGKIDHRTDLYAFGVMMREVLTGELPFQGSDRQLMGAHLLAEPPPICKPGLGLPAALEPIYRKLLAKKREDRFQSASEVEKALVDVFGGLALPPASPATSGTRPPVLEPAVVAAPYPSYSSAPRPAPPSPSQPVTAFPLPAVAAGAAASSSSPTLAMPSSRLPARATGGAAVAPPPAGAPPAGAPPAEIAAYPTAAPGLAPLAPGVSSRAPSPLPPAPAVPPPRLAIRYGYGGRENVLHVHLGARAAFGRQRRPDPQSSETWANVPSFVLRYLPQDDPQMARGTRETISRIHFEVAIAPDGVTITDRSSTGTFLNGARLQKGVATPLAQGASLRIGPGPLSLDVSIYIYPQTGAPEAVRFSRAGNATHHGYLLLAASAPIGAAADSALRLDARQGVRPLHGYLVRMADGGLGILACEGAPLEVDGVLIPAGTCAPIFPGSAVFFDRAPISLEVYHPESDEPLRI